MIPLLTIILLLFVLFDDDNVTNLILLFDTATTTTTTIRIHKYNNGYMIYARNSSILFACICLEAKSWSVNNLVTIIMLAGWVNVWQMKKGDNLQIWCHNFKSFFEIFNRACWWSKKVKKLFDGQLTAIAWMQLSGTLSRVNLNGGTQIDGFGF